MLRRAIRASFDNSYSPPLSDGFRNEVKYTLSPIEYLRLRDLCAGFMERDQNTDAGGEYVVKSCYFDTLRFQDYAEKLDGIYARQKYRVRTYGDTGYYKLEKKIKRGNLNKKISGDISAEAAESLISGDMDIETGSERADAIIKEMQLKGYRSSAYIQYARQAFAMSELDIRITFDRDVRALFGGCAFGGAQTPEPIPVFYANETIMEVKYKDILPQWLQKAIFRTAPSEFSVSKYANSLKYFVG